MTTFADISQSVTKYTAVVLAAIMETKKLKDLQEDLTLIDKFLGKVWIDLTDDGMVIHLKGTEEEVQQLKQGFTQSQIIYTSMPAKEGYNHTLIISHNQVFRILFKLGFDGRDVFDFYEAARLRKMLSSPATLTSYKQYKALARVTKDLQEMRAKLKFQTSRFNLSSLKDMSAEVENLHQLITKEIGQYKTISEARAEIAYQLYYVLLPKFKIFLSDREFQTAPLKTLFNEIYFDVQAMQALLLSFYDQIWGQYLVKKGRHFETPLPPTVSSVSCTREPIEPSFYLTDEAQGCRLDVSQVVGLIEANPTTGNAQVGADIQVTCTNLERKKPLHMIYIVDISASMGPVDYPHSPLDQVFTLIRTSMEQLEPTDGFDIITFSDTAKHVLGGKVGAHFSRYRPELFMGGGGTCLDKVAELIESSSLQGKPGPSSQTVVMLFSDGDTATSYGAKLGYLEARGASSIVRDKLLLNWQLDPEDTRFVAIGIGANIKCGVLDAFADEGDFVLFPNQDDRQSAEESFLRKCKPFTQVEVSGTLTSADKRYGYLETTRGRTLDLAYFEAIATILTGSRGSNPPLPFDIVMYIILPFLQPQHWMCISMGETISRKMKFVIPHTCLPGSMTFWTQTKQIGHLANDPKSTGEIESDAQVNRELDLRIKAHEKAVGEVQGVDEKGQASPPVTNQVACAQAWMTCMGRI